MTKKLLALYGLKWNPFLADVPPEALFVSPGVDSFAFRLENLVREGGFALITGDPGTGKSVVCRLLAHRLQQLPELEVGVLSRPQSRLADFYREIGDIFSVNLSPHNRWEASSPCARSGARTSPPLCSGPCFSSTNVENSVMWSYTFPEPLAASEPYHHFT